MSIALFLIEASVENMGFYRLGYIRFFSPAFNHHTR
ncbi:Uncharacterised protein [Vibrio cholerae]|nr:Uncharacterised protein [Vibrio cholerae]